MINFKVTSLHVLDNLPQNNEEKETDNKLDTSAASSSSASKIKPSSTPQLFKSHTPCICLGVIVEFEKIVRCLKSSDTDSNNKDSINDHLSSSVDLPLYQGSLSFKKTQHIITSVVIFQPHFKKTSSYRFVIVF